MEVLLWLTVSAVALLMAFAAYLAGRKASYAVKARDVLFELSPDPMVLVDDRGIIRQANVASHKRNERSNANAGYENSTKRTPQK